MVLVSASPSPGGDEIVAVEAEIVDEKTLVSGHAHQFHWEPDDVSVVVNNDGLVDVLCEWVSALTVGVDLVVPPDDFYYPLLRSDLPFELA